MAEDLRRDKSKSPGGSAGAFCWTIFFRPMPSKLKDP